MKDYIYLEQQISITSGFDVESQENWSSEKNGLLITFIFEYN